MKVSRGLLKVSLFKYIVYLILVVVGIYLLEYKTWSVNGVELEGKMIDQLMMMIPSQCGPMRYPVKYFQMFYEPLRPYIFWIMLFGIGFNFVCLAIESIPKPLAFVLSVLKLATGGIVTGLNLLFYSIFGKYEKKSDKAYQNDGFSNNFSTQNDDFSNNFNVQKDVFSNNRSNAPKIERREPQVAPPRNIPHHHISSITVFGVVSTIAIAIFFSVVYYFIFIKFDSNFFELDLINQLMKIFFAVVFVGIALYNAFGYPHSKRIFKKCKNACKRGMYLEEIEEIMSRYSSKPYQTRDGGYALPCEARGSLIFSHGDYEKITFYFDDNKKFVDYSEGYSRTTYR